MFYSRIGIWIGAGQYNGSGSTQNPRSAGRLRQPCDRNNVLLSSLYLCVDLAARGVPDTERPPLRQRDQGLPQAPLRHHPLPSQGMALFSLPSFIDFFSPWCGSGIQIRSCIENFRIRIIIHTDPHQYFFYVWGLFIFLKTTLQNWQVIMILIQDDLQENTNNCLLLYNYILIWFCKQACF